MELVETHCHLPALKGVEMEEVFEKAFKCGVTRMLCIGAGTGEDSAGQAIALADQYEHIWASVGVHPHDAGDHTKLDHLEKYFQHPKVVAIGETGLDFFRDWAPKDRQIELFKETIRIAKEVKKPLIIHCRDAMEETYNILAEAGADEVGGVFHCFAGSSQDAAKVADLNFLVSFTGNITFKKAENIREAARNTPLSQIMLETDCPYMAPEPFRGQQAEPMHVYQVALKLSEIKGVSLTEVAETTTGNALRLFKGMT